MTKLHGAVREALDRCPKIDIHTHLSPGRLMARGLDDILLYHMVNTELYSAGAPDGERVPEDRDEEAALERLKRAIPHLERIRNTSLFWGLKMILRDLYDWNEDITPSNWRELHAHIQECNRDDGSRARAVLRNLNIKKTGTEFVRRAGGMADDIFDYALEWAFFARVQWGQPDIALYELERAWNSPGPQKPLPVTLKKSDRAVFTKRIEKPCHIREAVSRYCSLIPYDRVDATTQHLSTDLDYRWCADGEVETALAKRAEAGNAERDIYSSAVLYAFLSELQKHGDEIVFQFSLGAEALPFESGARLRQETVGQLAGLLASFPGLRFMCFNASRHAHQSLCTLVREFPNFSLAGFWWHSFFPGALRELIEERLDMVPVNRQCGFFTDAYCVDWVHGKSRILLDQYARVFSEKIEAGQYSLGDVERISEEIFFKTPVELLSFKV